jgi:hypothetical protein
MHKQLRTHTMLVASQGEALPAGRDEAGTEGPPDSPAHASFWTAYPSSWCGAGGKSGVGSWRFVGDLEPQPLASRDICSLLRFRAQEAIRSARSLLSPLFSRLQLGFR